MYWEVWELELRSKAPSSSPHRSTHDEQSAQGARARTPTPFFLYERTKAVQQAVLFYSIIVFIQWCISLLQEEDDARQCELWSAFERVHSNAIVIDPLLESVFVL